MVDGVKLRPHSFRFSSDRPPRWCGYTQGHSGVGGQAATAGVGPIDRYAATTASSVSIHTKNRIMVSSFFVVTVAGGSLARSEGTRPPLRTATANFEAPLPSTSASR